MRALLLLVVLAGLAALAHAQSDDQYCLAKDNFPYLHFGSKTAYERVYDHKDSPQNVPFCRPVGLWMLSTGGTSYPDLDALVPMQESLPWMQDLILQNAMAEAGQPAVAWTKNRASSLPGSGRRRNCTPIALWTMGRPGTRLPDEESIKKLQSLDGLKSQIMRNHQRYQGRLCQEDLSALQRWHFNVTPDKALRLTGQGQADLTFLARRMRRRLPELLNTTYSPERFKFRYTAAQRTQESAEAFASGLFGGEVEMPKPLANDPLLQFDQLCPAWKADRQRALLEVDLFERGPEMETTLARVSRRLGFNYNLSLENVDLMWEMCRYDKAWKYVSLSPWCSAFTEDDLKVMEYREDLVYYYSYSYGNDLNVKLGCPPVKDMMDHFSRMEMAMAGGGANPEYESLRPPVGMFHFTHDAALHMMLAALGVAKDPIPLMANNMDQQSKREFRTSFFGSFAANLAAVFYQCEQGDRHRVMFYLRERIVQMEGCQVGLCSWEALRTRLARAAEHCDLHFCHASGAAASTTASLTVALGASALLAYLGWRA